jgi:hypothetical protein
MKVSKERGGQWGELTLLNQESTLAVEYPSHEALTDALISAVADTRKRIQGVRTRAGLKFLEILRHVRKKGEFLAVADAPGDFSLILLDAGYSGGGFSLATGDKWFPALSTMYGSRWRVYGTTGNVTNFDEVKSLPRRFALVTADGWSSDFASLVRGEILAISLAVLKGGSAVIKLLAIDTNEMLSLVKWAISMFDDFIIIKPKHSRAINDERYLILNGFHGVSAMPRVSEGVWLDPLKHTHLTGVDVVIAASNRELGHRQVEALRVMLELIHRDEPIYQPFVENRMLQKMAQLERRFTFLLPGTMGVNFGYRCVVISGVPLLLCDFSFPLYILKDQNLGALSKVSLQMEVMRGRRLVGNFLAMPWIKGAYLHRVALFSLSNTMNSLHAWQEFMKGGGDFTFNYPNPSAVATYGERPVSRIKIFTIKSPVSSSDVMVTKSETKEFSDWMQPPSRMMAWALFSGIKCYQYSYPDFAAVMCSDGYDIGKGEFGPFNPNDRFMGCFTYFTTRSPGTEFPDYRNTQTWWVKAPTALLRRELFMGPDDARRYRAIGIKLLPIETRVFLKKDYYYGFIPSLDRAIDVSGHAISMLIMAGLGMVDIGRYWDTVMAMSKVALSKPGSNQEYVAMIKERVLTEDALHDPYKVWHSIWDYRAALNAYIAGAKDMRYPISVWVVRITQYKLDEMEQLLPELRNLKRNALDALVRAAVKRV